MITRLIFSILTLIAIGCQVSENQTPLEAPQRDAADWYFASWDTALTVESINDSTSDGSHRVKIFRGSIGGLWALDKAERIYPLLSTITGDFPENRGYDTTLFNSLTDTSLAWWVGEYEGVRIPYAVTADAIEYYLELSRSIRNADPEENRRRCRIRTSFTYIGTCRNWEIYAAPDTVYHWVEVAHLDVHWMNGGCGLGGMSFWRKRTVIFDSRTRKLLRIMGDGPGIIARS